jgi:hypothetical protein
MPAQRCVKGNKLEYKWGESGTCYTYTAGNASSRKRAKAKAEKQGRAAYASGYKANK